MAWTMDTDVADGVYRINTTLQDQLGEQIRKVFSIHNPGTGETVEDFMQAFEALTDGGLVSASASLAVGVTDPSATISASGDFSYVNNILVLGFTRAHPLNAAKTVTTTFSIPAPASALYTGTTINIGTDPGDFASAAGLTETLAALIDFLEENLVYTDVSGTTTVGGWTYSAGASGIISQARILDGVPNS